MAPAEVAVGRFSAGDLAGWKVREFKGRTRYEIEDDPEGGGGRVLAASSRGAASALYHEREIDLAATPILSWRWRVESPLPIVPTSGARPATTSRRGCTWCPKAAVSSASPSG